MSDEKKKAPDATYVVQREAMIQPVDSEVVETFWADIATVKVAGGTNRKTVLKRALAEAKDLPGKPRLRVLDADSAFVHEPEAVQPPMEWKL